MRFRVGWRWLQSSGHATSNLRPARPLDVPACDLGCEASHLLGERIPRRSLVLRPWVYEAHRGGCRRGKLLPSRGLYLHGFALSLEPASQALVSLTDAAFACRMANLGSRAG